MGKSILIIAAVIVLVLSGLAFAHTMGTGGGCCGGGLHHTCSLHHAQ